MLTRLKKGTIALILVGVVLLVACGSNTTPAAESSLATIPLEPSSTPAPTTTTEVESAEPATAVPATPLPSPTPAAVLREYRLDPEKSEVRFLIDEVLFGSDKTVIGSTSQMTATVRLDLAYPQQTELSTVEVDAHTLVTDDSFRNRALRGQILQTDEPGNRLITFVPTTLAGLPETIAVGETADVEVTGDLTISGVTQAVVLPLMITVQSADQLVGSGSLIVDRTDYGLEIPSVRGVANVATDVKIEVDFVADAAQQ